MGGNGSGSATTTRRKALNILGNSSYGAYNRKLFASIGEKEISNVETYFVVQEKSEYF